MKSLFLLRLVLRLVALASAGVFVAFVCLFLVPDSPRRVADALLKNFLDDLIDWTAEYAVLDQITDDETGKIIELAHVSNFSSDLVTVYVYSDKQEGRHYSRWTPTVIETLHAATARIKYDGACYTVIISSHTIQYGRRYWQDPKSDKRICFDIRPHGEVPAAYGEPAFTR